MKKHINPQLMYESMPKETIRCELCDSWVIQPILYRDRYHMGINTGMCRNCGFLFTNPRPTQEAINKFYSEQYRDFYTGGTDPADEYKLETHIPKRQWMVEHLLPFLKNNDRPRVLDVGCGGGAILHLLRKQFPCAELFGVEPYQKYADYAEKMSGASVFAGDVDTFLDRNASALKNSLDAVIMNHSFEHMYNPLKKLIALRELIKPEGLILIQVPNPLSPHWKNVVSMFHIAHTNHFTPVTMEYTFRLSGFEILKKYEISEPVHRLAMTYLGRKTGDVPDHASVAKPTNENLLKLYESFNKFREQVKIPAAVNPIRRVWVCFKDRGIRYTLWRFGDYFKNLLIKVLNLINPVRWTHYDSVGGYFRHAHNNRILKEMISGRKILVLGSGPSASGFESLPEDVLLFTCNATPRLLKEKKYQRPIDLYLTRTKALSKDYPDSEKLITEITANIFITDDRSHIRKLKMPDTTFKKLLADHQKDNYYLKKIIYPTRIEQIKTDDVTWTSAGLRLLQYALRFNAKEIYLLGIDLGADEYFWGGRFLHKHSMDQKFMKIVSKRFENVFSLSPESPITKYIPFKDFGSTIEKQR